LEGHVGSLAIIIEVDWREVGGEIAYRMNRFSSSVAAMICLRFDGRRGCCEEEDGQLQRREKDQAEFIAGV